MLYKVNAIVLHTIKYGDSGIITQVYTEQFGRQSFIVQGVRKAKSKISASLFQPLSLLNFDAYIKESRELQQIKEVRPSCVLHHLHFEIKRSSVALFIAEVLYRCLREVEPNKKLFEYVYNAVQILDIMEQGTENFHLVFLLQFTKYLGIYPGEELTFLNAKPILQQRLQDLQDCSLSESYTLKLDAQGRNEIIEVLLDYYEKHLGAIGKMQSLSILREIFH